ncbi:alkyl sulfatase C-terminal domain-containing protein, partial [Neomesorhizobium albiziae]
IKGGSLLSENPGSIPRGNQQGEYRWLAMALKHVVFADPDNTVAKDLLADSYEQMGYQAESGPWRSIYLMGAFELRNGVPTGGGTVTASSDTIRAMPPELLFNYLGVRLNGEKAAGKKLSLNVNFTDLNQPYELLIENGALEVNPALASDAEATVTLTKPVLDSVQLGETTLEQAIANGDIKVEGRKEALGEFLAMLDNYPFWFNIVTP